MQEPPRKRRRAIVACLACRNRKSRCSGGRPQCSRCIELGLTCQYTSGAQDHEPVLMGAEHVLALEDRLAHLESLLRNSTTQPPNGADGGNERTNRNASDDPTDGMGHFVVGNEEERAYFGPSSNIAFTSDLSRALKRLSRTRGEVSSDNSYPPMLDFHIARVSPPASRPIETCKVGAAALTGSGTESIFYLPPHSETVALIDRYFSNTGLLYPYLHEESFRETYARLKENHKTTRRTWLGLLNMVLAMATQTTERLAGEEDCREVQSQAFYRRANGLCAEYVSSGASLEIVQYLLLVSQFKQGTRSSIQTWTTHGLAVKVALQLGLHSAEASKRFPPVEREIRKRTWFGCIVLDRSLSTTLGRPASIPEQYSRLELPVYFDLVETRARQIEARQRCRYSTDFFNVTIRLYSILSKVLDLLYDGNLGSEEKVPSYELIARVLRMRHLLDEWVPRLPMHMPLIKAVEIPIQLGKNATIDRFRLVLTMRYHNLRILTHRVVLARLCEMIEDYDLQDQDALALHDISRSTVHIVLESATDIIDTVHSVVESERVPCGLLGAWWFTLYYAFDAALVIFTIFLLAKRSTYVSIDPPHSLPSLKQTFVGCIGSLRRLEEQNQTIEKCAQCLQRLAEVWDIIESTTQISTATSTRIQPTAPIADIVDQNLSFMDFTFMTHELFDVTDGFLSSRGF